MRTSRVLAILLALSAGMQTAGANHNARPPLAADAFMLTNPSKVGNISMPTAFGRPSPNALRHSHDTDAQYGERIAQQSAQVIPPSMALRLALSYSPGSQGLDVTLVQGRRLMYAVKLKTGTRVHRVLVDAHTGQILGE